MRLGFEMISARRIVPRFLLQRLSAGAGMGTAGGINTSQRWWLSASADAIGGWHRAFSVLTNIQAGGYDAVLGAFAQFSLRTLINLRLSTVMLSLSNTVLIPDLRPRLVLS
jgi:hypothetical protein